MRDIDVIVNGGNGCAREGWNGFRMETEWEGYTWGGGGMLAGFDAEERGNDGVGRLAREKKTLLCKSKVLN